MCLFAMKEEANPAAGEHPRGPRLLFVTALFAVLLNYPLLAIFDHQGRVAGVPVLYWYVLLTWALLIVVTAWLVRLFSK